MVGRGLGETSPQAAGEAAIERGYELQWFCNNKAAGIEVLKACGIMPGIAEQLCGAECMRRLNAGLGRRP